MKIAVISYFFGSPFKPFIAGPAAHVYYLTHELAKLGHIIHIFTSANKTSVRKKKLGKGKLVIHKIGCKTVITNNPEERLSNYLRMEEFDKKVFSQVVKENKNGKFDLINTHGFLTNMAFFLKELLNIKWVHTIHAVDVLRIKKIKESSPYPELVEVWEGTVKYADGFIAVSNDIKRSFCKCYKIDPKKVKVISNGVSTEFFHPMKINRGRMGFKDDDKIVLYIGRFSREKGIEILLDVMKEILPNEKNIKFIIVAPFIGVHTRIKKIERSLSNLQKKFKERINFFGMLPQRTLVKLYNISDIYIQPSLYEAFPLTVLEAMACGKVVVASKVGGIPEFVKDKVNGFLVNPSGSEFVKRILFLLKNEDLLQKIKINAIQTAENFSWAKIAKRTLKFYKTVSEK